MIMQKIEKRNVQGIHSLTPLQEGLLYHYLKNPGEGYVEQLTLYVEGPVEIETFWEAWDGVARANEALRTVFRWEEVDHPVQVVLKDHCPSRKFEDLSSLREDDVLPRLQQAKGELRDPAALMAGVPFKVALFKTGEGAFEIVIQSTVPANIWTQDTGRRRKQTIKTPLILKSNEMLNRVC